MNELPPEHQSRLDRELDEGEQINWVAQPSRRVLWREYCAPLTGITWLFGVTAAIIFVIGIVYLILKIEPRPGERASATPFFVLGAAILAFIGAAWPMAWWGTKDTAKNTIYALTNKRAIIIHVHRDGSITERDYRGDELIHLARKEYKDGSGTLTFESARGAGHSSQTASRHKFQAIERVIEVERMLRDQFGNC